MDPRNVARFSEAGDFVSLKVAHDGAEPQLSFAVALRHEGLEHRVDAAALEHVDERNLVFLVRDVGAVPEGLAAAGLDLVFGSAAREDPVDLVARRSSARVQVLPESCQPESPMVFPSRSSMRSRGLPFVVTMLRVRKPRMMKKGTATMPWALFWSMRRL